MAKTRQGKTAENLAETLAAGNFTADGQIMKALNGGVFIDFRFQNIDDFLILANDPTGQKAYIIFDPGAESLQLGYKAAPGIYLEAKENYIQLNVDGKDTYFFINPGNAGINDISLFGPQEITAFSVKENVTSDAIANGSFYGVFINTGGFPAFSTMKQNVSRSVIIGGLGLTAKTDNTLYSNQISLQESGVLFDSIIKSGAVTADRELTTPNKDGEIGLANEFSEYYFQNNAVVTALVLNTPTKILGAYLNGLSSGTFTILNGEITYTGIEPCIAKVETTLTAIRVGPGSPKYKFSIALNGVPIPMSQIIRDIGNSEAAISLQTLIELNNGDVISNFTENITNNNDVTTININTILTLLC